MAFEVENENTGLIFSNDSDNPKAPNFNGVINVEGEQFEIALWEKEFKGGKTGFSVKISEPREQSSSSTKPAPKRSGGSSNSSGTSAGLKPRPKPSR